MRIDKSVVKVGSDFEMFLQNKEGKIISAIPFIQGTKQDPEQLPKKGCCLQHDNVTAECNIPAVSLLEVNEFWNNMEYVRGYIMDTIGKKEGLKLVCCPSAELEEDQLLDDEAKAFGCDASYNAWKDGDINDKPDGLSTNLRSCAAHVHLSYNEPDIQTSLDLMKVFDVFLSVPFILLDTHNEDLKRRTLYGKAGEFRLQHYGPKAAGFEARTLSNLWIETKEKVEYAFHQLNRMFDHYNDYGLTLIEEHAEDIQTAINTCDKKLARKLCDTFNIVLPITLVEEYV